MEGNQAKLSRCDPHSMISSATASANPSSDVGVNANLRNVGGAAVEESVLVRILITPGDTSLRYKPSIATSHGNLE